MSFRSSFAAVFLLCLLAAAEFHLFAEVGSREKWEVQYLWDENDGTFTLTDLKFPSAKRGIASGFLTKKVTNVILGSYEKEVPFVLITSNGGQSWSQVVTKQVPNTLFFLDDSLGWFVSDTGIWKTTESGRTWSQVSKLKDITRVYFLDAKHGYAVGNEKRVLESQDGGVNWAPLAIADEPKTKKEWTVYGAVSFSDQNTGSIAGWSRAPNADDSVPQWLHPESPGSERTPPEITILLNTKDGGKTWKSFTQSFYGEMTRIDFGGKGRSLALFEFPKTYPWPSEVFEMNGDAGGNRRVFRERDRAITDVLLQPDGTAFLGGSEPPGHVHPSSIPGKVKILQSADLENWSEMAVDYRAVARRVWLASPDAENVWAATDTGFILKLQRK